MRRAAATPLVLLALFASTLTAARAAEGMWMPQQIPELAAQLRELGFDGDPHVFADLTAHPMNAIISLGGCSASFVSPDGLIATNHHCVLGALQYNSTADRNLLRDGYVARERGQELWNGPGSRVFVTVSVKEVTAELKAKLADGLADRERFDAIERFQKERVAACEKGGLRCRVQSFFDGLRYFEIGQLEIEDIRLVYAPAEGIGVFGGETDNWQWPRHTGDFALYRAYVGPDGKPRPNAPDNVPFHPRHWLTVSPKGASPGDLVFVAGYPGATDRHATYAEIRELAEWSYPRLIRRAHEQLAIMEKVADANPGAALVVATRKRYLANGMANREGRLKGLLQGGLLARKEAQERELAAWIAVDPARQAKWGDVLPALNAEQAAKDRTRQRDGAFAAVYSASSVLGAANTIYRFSLELPKPDMEREPEYQERNWKRIREGQQRLQKSLDAAVDRALLRHTLLEVAGLPNDQRIPALDAATGLAPGLSAEAAGQIIDKFLDCLYAGTKLTDAKVRLDLLGKPTAELLAAKDPFVELAAALAPFDREIEDRDKARSGRMSALRPRFMDALLAKNGGLVAPDANGSLRVTFGTVKGVRSRDGVEFLPQTTLEGILQKHTGEGEFDAPKRQLEAIRALRGGKASPYVDPALRDVPVNFLSSVDTTGGNSGSAVLNAKGEFVGLLFDGTYDTVASDLLFDPVRTRAINCDVRYLLWTLAEVEGATGILRELGFR